MVQRPLRPSRSSNHHSGSPVDVPYRNVRAVLVTEAMAAMREYSREDDVVLITYLDIDMCFTVLTTSY